MGTAPRARSQTRRPLLHPQAIPIRSRVRDCESLKTATGDVSERPVNKDEELFISYGPKWFESRSLVLELTLCMGGLWLLRGFNARTVLQVAQKTTQSLDCPGRNISAIPVPKAT